MNGQTIVREIVAVARDLSSMPRMATVTSQVIDEIEGLTDRNQHIPAYLRIFRNARSRHPPS